MSMLKAYSPEYGYQYQILVRYIYNKEFEHCDYAVDKKEMKYLLYEYKIAYGSDFIFRTIPLPKKYWNYVKEELV